MARAAREAARVLLTRRGAAAPHHASAGGASRNRELSSAGLAQDKHLPTVAPGQ
jgi:hypothetical protein